MKSSRDRRIVSLVPRVRPAQIENPSQRRPPQRSSPRIQTTPNLEPALGDALQLLSGPVRDHFSPAINRDRRDIQRAGDDAGGPEVGKDGGLEHRPKLTKVVNFNQLADDRTRSTLDALRRMGADLSNVLTLVNMSTLQERFAEVMRERGVEPPEVATALGVTSAAIHKILAGRTTTLRKSTAEKASRFFKVRAEWLRYGKGPKKLDTAETDWATMQDLLITLELVEKNMGSTMQVIGLLKQRLGASANKQQPASKKKKRG
jgi:hypothetical protein